MSEPKKTCFVIQVFDEGKYDKRYNEVYLKSIEAVDLTPIRADKVLGTKPIIETIEESISSADVVLADISESNENVFLELGYALAKNKPCVIIADKEIRSELPFDVRHRPVIFYNTHSPSSFSSLGKKISSNLKAELEKEKRIILSNVKTHGEISLEEYENIVIGIILSESQSEPNGVSAHYVSREFEQFDYSPSTLGVAIESLKNKNLINIIKLTDDQWGQEYTAYSLTDDGTRYVLENRSVFVAKKPVSDEEFDIPF